jgi:hypothetical protein
MVQAVIRIVLTDRITESVITAHLIMDTAALITAAARLSCLEAAIALAIATNMDGGIRE